MNKKLDDMIEEIIDACQSDRYPQVHRDWVKDILDRSGLLKTSQDDQDDP